MVENVSHNLYKSERKTWTNLSRGTGRILTPQLKDRTDKGGDFQRKIKLLDTRLSRLRFPA